MNMRNDARNLSNDPVVLHPIGYVMLSFDKPDAVEQSNGVRSRIILDESLQEGLEGLETDQEILVVFWFHCSNGFELRQHPRGDRSHPRRGVFTLRSPNRPNPIGISRVKVTALEDNVLTVSGLDAFNGTPVLDIKPLTGN